MDLKYANIENNKPFYDKIYKYFFELSFCFILVTMKSQHWVSNLLIKCDLYNETYDLFIPVICQVLSVCNAIEVDTRQSLYSTDLP